MTETRLLDAVEAYNRAKVDRYRQFKPSRGSERDELGINVDCSACADGRHFVGVGAGVSNAFPRDLCLRVGAYANDITEPLKKAAGIIRQNRRKGQTIEGQRSVLLANGVFFEESGPDALFAKRSAQLLAEQAKEIVLNAQPELEPVLDVAAGVVYHHDRSLTIFDRSI